MKIKSRYLLPLVILLIGVITPTFLFTMKASAATFEVDSTLDATDDDIGNGLCDDGSGNCTLRAAIQEANATPESDTITFAIAGAGPHTIALLDFLPEITTPITINGASQTGATCGDLVPDELPAASNTPHDLRIVIDGSDLTYVDVNLAILRFETGSSGSSVTGLGIVNAGLDGNDQVYGLVIGDNVSNMVISCNYFGADTDGVTYAENFASDLYSVNGDGTNITIEDNLFAKRLIVSEGSNYVVESNLFCTDETGQNELTDSEDYSQGIYVEGAATSQVNNNVVAGCENQGIGVNGADSVSITDNYIGANMNGDSVGNGSEGIQSSSSTSLTITSNLVANNDGTGISVSDGTGEASDNTLRDNSLFGANISGLDGGSYTLRDNLIHGNRDGVSALANSVIHNNTIYSNDYTGVRVRQQGATITGNYIGLDASGQPAGNGTDGVEVFTDTDSVGTDIFSVIGGDSLEDRNVISANTNAGVHIYNDGCSVTRNSRVTGNYIGLNVGGEVADGYGNGGAGVQANEIFTQDCGGGVSVYNHAIGGDNPGEQNVIAGNEGDGVQIYSQPDETCDDEFDEYDGDTYLCGGSDVFNIAILPNSIHSNSGLGINLATDTDNDGVADVETGPATKNITDPATYPAEQANHFVAYPEITNAVYGDDYVKVVYDFDAKDDDGTIDVVGYRLDFYINDSQDPSGYGQGKTHLGHFFVDGDEAAAEHTFITDLALGDDVNVSATATLLTTDSFIPEEEVIPLGNVVISSNAKTGIISKISEFFIPTASAAEVTPTEGSYIYGSTSEFSSFTSLSEDPASSLADTGSSRTTVMAIVASLLSAGTLMLATKNRRKSFIGV